jgi:hypothetical protein
VPDFCISFGEEAIGLDLCDFYEELGICNHSPVTPEAKGEVLLGPTTFSCLSSDGSISSAECLERKFSWENVAAQIEAAVHKAVPRGEWKTNPKASEAIEKEGNALMDAGTWDFNTATFRDEIIEKARKTGKKVHLGDLLTTCTIKHWENPLLHKYKGRICFRGDIVKDEFGAPAVFQDLSSNPTSIHGANANMCYGAAPGHCTTQADAVRAYVQSLLKSMHETWVCVPPELWPKDGSLEAKGFKPYKEADRDRRPMCKLVKALYGHPESGGHWEKHLTDAIIAIGGRACETHPSFFWVS